MTGDDVVARFGTGLAETTVVRTATGFVWTRRPGRDVRADRQHQPAPVPADFIRRAESASTDAFTFAVPTTRAGSTHAWNAPGPSSAAHLLLEGTQQNPAAPPGIAHTYGRHLRAFHETGATDATGYPAPRFPTRLATWIHTPDGPRAAPAFHTILRQGLGTRRWDLLTAYAQEALTPPEHPAVVVGWATLGSLVVAQSPAAAPVSALLCGPEGALAAPEIDLGCAVGELHEIALSLTARSLPAQTVTAWRDALLAGYGAPVDTARTARTAVVRIAAHAHDFAAYVGFHTELHAYVGMLADLLDTEGTQTMARETS